MIDGVGSRPFSAVTIPPIAPPAVTYKSEVIKASREQFGEQRAKIEAAVISELATDPADMVPEPKAKEYKSTKSASPAPRSVTTSPTRTERPRQQQELRTQEARSPEPRMQERRQDAPVRERVASAPAAKTGEDLKSILRAMTAESAKKAPAPQVKKVETAPLKSVLADVLKKSQEKPEAKPEARSQPVPDTRKVFEVPEETLKAIFREQ